MIEEVKVVDLETTLLGLLYNNLKEIVKIKDEIKPEYFEKEQNQKVYSMFLEMYAEGINLDGEDKKICIIKSKLKEIFTEDKDAIDYFNILEVQALGSKDITAYAKELISYYLIRYAQKVSKDLSDLSINNVIDAGEYLKTINKAKDAFNVSSNKSKTQTIGEILNNIYDYASQGYSEDGTRPISISSGYKKIDDMLNGLNPGNLIVIGARPGTGKTALATNIGYNVAKKGIKVILFSLEMTSEEIAKRIIASDSFINYGNLITYDIKEQDLDAFVKTIKEDKKLDLLINSEGKVTASFVLQKAKECNAKLIIIDYLQLMNPERVADNRNLEIGQITSELKKIAKELDVPIILLSQLNRNFENNSKEEPVLSDLRDSGSIEQDADSVLFLYKDKNQTEQSSRMLTNVKVAKNRHGRTGTFQLTFDAPRFRFME